MISSLSQLASFFGMASSRGEGLTGLETSARINLELLADEVLLDGVQTVLHFSIADPFRNLR